MCFSEVDVLLTFSQVYWWIMVVLITKMLSQVLVVTQMLRCNSVSELTMLIFFGRYHFIPFQRIDFLLRLIAKMAILDLFEFLKLSI